MIDIQVLASSSSGNCYYINDGQTPLLLDCGITFKEIQRRLNFQTSSITGVLLSHEHGDHSKACKDVLKAGLDIYSQEDTFDALGLNSHRIRPVFPKEQFPIGTWSVLPFDLEHDCANLGFLMQSNVTGEKLLYVTDTYYCRYNFSGLNYIMIECNHSYEILRANVDSGDLPVAMKNRLIKSHFSLENVKEFLKSNDLSQVQAIYLIHLSDGNSHAEQFKREIMAQTGKLVVVADK